MEPTETQVVAPPPLLHKVDDACARLGGLGRTTFYAEVKAGRIRTLKIAGRTFVAEAELIRYVEGLSA